MRIFHYSLIEKTICNISVRLQRRIPAGLRAYISSYVQFYNFSSMKRDLLHDFFLAFPFWTENTYICAEILPFRIFLTLAFF